MNSALPIHDGLTGASRLPPLVRTGDGASVLELTVLVSMGACAALASGLLDLSWRIPGHAIIRAVFPMALGLALVPRRGGGSVMGAGAAGTALAMTLAGAGTGGAGAITSLCLIGPFLDGALWGARRGWRLYLGFGLAGLAANLVAFAVRAGTKLAGWEHLASRRWEEWWSAAIVSYAICGLAAGLLSAFVWFRLTRRAAAETEESK